MEGMPYIENMYHGRDVPKDMKGVMFSTRCQRDSYEDDVKKCWPCTKAMINRKKKVEKDDEFDQKARMYSARRKAIAQVIDVTPCMNKQNEIRRALKKCFGKHGKMDNCEDCFLNDVCESFIQKWYMPQKCWERFNDHFKDYGDITDMNKMIPVRIKRIGKGQYDTKYDTEVFSKNVMEIPEKLQDRIKKHLIDLTKEDPKPKGDTEELKKFYQDFYAFADVKADDDDDDDDDDDGGKKKHEKKNKKHKHGKKHRFPREEREEKRENRDELRENMKKKARHGKLDRNTD
jgi:hypothetical protein